VGYTKKGNKRAILHNQKCGKPSNGKECRSGEKWARTLVDFPHDEGRGGRRNLFRKKVKRRKKHQTQKSPKKTPGKPR